MELFTKHLSEAQSLLSQVLSDQAFMQSAQRAGEAMVASLRSGGKILSCGNGGSMCDAMHFAEELTGRYRNDRRPIAAMALSDVSHMSCVANDYGYDYVFARGVQAFGKPGDVLLAISTSGNSKNILFAAEAAREQGLTVVALTGKDGGKLASIAHAEVRVPWMGYADRIQEIHIKVIHAWMDLIEEQLVLK
jgi:D-sedoheptulose 7-phosphate isomerase